MSRSILRVLSIIVLAAIATASASRLVCALPCAPDAATPSMPGASAHCSPPAETSGSRMVAADAGCDDCGRLGLAEADRVAPRTAVQTSPLPLAAFASASASEPPARAVLLPQPLDTRPGWRGLVQTPLPLRI